MKVVTLALFAFAVTLAMAMGAHATGPTNGNFGGNGEAFFNTELPGFDHHYTNAKNPDVRMDWDNHRMAVPGKGGHHANENAAVQAHGDQTLVDPQDTL